MAKVDVEARDGKFRNIGKYLYVRNGKVYGVKWHKNKNIKKKAPMQGALALNDRGEPTKALRDWARLFAMQVENEDYVKSLERSADVPTFAEVIRKYKVIAEVERAVSGRPREVSVVRNVCALERVVKAVGLSVEDRIDKLEGKDVEAWLYEAVGAGDLRAVSAYAYVAGAMSVFAEWARVKYAAQGWRIPKWSDMPKPRGKAIQVRYNRPTDALRERTVAWMRSLEGVNNEAWLATTLMSQFAMRNGDVNRLRWSDIRRIDGVWVLHYIPSKTAVSTGCRGVSWPMTDELYERMRAARVDDELVVPDKDVWGAINAAMRLIGWAGTKCSYELRKMAVDQVYRSMGIERAVQISGDDPKTLMRYYADASRVSMVPVGDLYK